MRRDYEPYFRQLQQGILPLGYVAVEESELEAQFILGSGWRVSFECERYYGPMFGLFIVPPQPLVKRARGYEVGQLMEVFEQRDGVRYGKPTLENQINFLTSHQSRIFADPASYEGDYARLHDLH